MPNKIADALRSIDTERNQRRKWKRSLNNFKEKIRFRLNFRSVWMDP